MKLYIKLFASGIVALLVAPYIKDLSETLNIVGGLLFIVGLAGICITNAIED